MARVRRGGGAGRKLARPARAKYLPPMGKLLKLAVLIGLVAALLALVPLGGRTLLDRWRAARGPGDFTARLWAEMRGVMPPPAPGTPAPPRKARPGRPPGAAEPSSPDQPLESTTEAERKSLDRLLDQHLSEKPKR
jgi:hypothetical protein